MLINKLHVCAPSYEQLYDKFAQSISDMDHLYGLGFRTAKKVFDNWRISKLLWICVVKDAERLII